MKAFTINLDKTIYDDSTFYGVSIAGEINRITKERELWLQKHIGLYGKLPKFICKRIFKIEIHTTIGFEIYILRKFGKVIATHKFND